MSDLLQSFALMALSDPAPAALPLLIVGGLGVLGLLFALSRVADPRTRGFLVRVILLGIVARVLLLLALEVTIGPYPFAPDALTYEIVGRKIVEAWSGLRPMPPEMAQSTEFGYYLINAVFILIFGSQSSAPRTLNILCGVWVAIPAYYLARELTGGNHRVAKIVTVLTVFFPSLVLWSTLNIREAPTILALVSIVYFLYRAGNRPRVRHLLGLLAAFGALALSREYLFLLVGCAAGVGLLVSHLRSVVWRMFLGISTLASVLFVAGRIDIGSSLLDAPALEAIDYLRRDLALGAGSAFGQGADTTSLSGLLAYLPVGLAYFLFAPFPWAVGSPLQAVTVPEQLTWYVLFLFSLWGMGVALRQDPRRFGLVFFVTGAMVLSYSLVEGNVGTAYRHRAQIYPFLFIFSAMGIDGFRRARLASGAWGASRRRPGGDSPMVEGEDWEEVDLPRSRGSGS